LTRVTAVVYHRCCYRIPGRAFFGVDEPMGDLPAVQIQDLKKTYRDGWSRKRIEALKGISFEVQRGDIFGLLGPNGAGKTTAVKILLGVVRKTGGAASLLGQPAGSAAGRRDVGYLPENLTIPGHHTAATAMEYYGNLNGLSVAEVKRRRDPILERVGLADWVKVGVRKYSKGMRQRLGLALALLHDPQLLMLDEPTDGLDPLGRAQVRELLAELKQQGKTIFLNSHLLQEVEMVCDRVAILDAGQLRFVGSVDEITKLSGSEENLEVVFEVAGEEDAIRNALDTWRQWTRTKVAEGVYRVRISLPNQAAVDQHVDDLRCSGISLVGLARRRVSLEDAFLNLLQPEREA
jgi:ABC-2 type transport system ATP-binding protein